LLVIRAVLAPIRRYGYSINIKRIDQSAIYTPERRREQRWACTHRKVEQSILWEAYRASLFADGNELVPGWDTFEWRPIALNFGAESKPPL
jgi:hypothetical protein